jgi:5'-deoxynucleotidase
MNNFLSAWLRAKNIDRWTLETNLVNFNDATHSFECTVVGHLIAIIDRDIFKSNINPERIAVLCTYHESDEVGGMGDLNSRAKYLDPECTKAIKLLENIFEKNLLSSLPKELQASFSDLIIQKKNTRDSEICKAADDICAYLESQKEVLLGNQDFVDCNKTCAIKVKGWGDKFECVQYFIDHFLTGGNQSVDQMFSDSPKDAV